MIIKGFEIDDQGNIVLQCLDNGGERVTVELTKHIREQAEAAVAEHMSKYHGHQL